MDAMKLIKTRRTFRRFDQSLPVPKEVVADMREAVRYSSSGRNAQVLKVVFAQSPDLVEALFPFTHYAGSLPPEIGQPKEGEHPTLFAFVIGPNKPNPMFDIDTGIVITNMTAVAWEHGVGSVILRNIEKDNIAKTLQLGDEWVINTAVAFGYPTHKAYVVDVPDNGKVAYYLDEHNDYAVPKKSIEELTEVR